MHRMLAILAVWRRSITAGYPEGACKSPPAEGWGTWVSTAQQQRVAVGRFRTAFRAVTDVAMTAVALYGIWHQEHTGKPQWQLLLTYVVILGLIPATHAVALARSALQGPQQVAAAPVPSTPGTDSSP